MNEIQKIVDMVFVELQKNKSSVVDTEKAIIDFQSKINLYSDQQLEHLLITAGYIPDFYGADSSEETLYTKLCEVLEAVWADRMGYTSKILTVKGGAEDIDIFIDGKVIVSDTKAFRLSRSQAAPNVKDFVKPRDYTLWLSKFRESDRLGGLVVYPQLHEWSGKSHTYDYCSDKSEPIVMLPYHYLAYLLYAKNKTNFNVNRLVELWNYSKIFPNKIGSRVEYWDKIDKELIQITNSNPQDFHNYMIEAEKQMYEYVNKELVYIENSKSHLVETIQDEIDTIPDDEIKERFKEYRVNNETSLHNSMLQRISDMRLDKKHEHTGYLRHLKKKKF